MTSDEQAVVNTIVDYADLLDAGDLEATAALWTADGVLAVFGEEYVGPTAIRDFFSGAITGKHINGPPSIAIDGDRARARTAYAFWRSEDGSLFSLGRYDDQLVRTRDGWRFERREIEIELRPG